MTKEEKEQLKEWLRSWFYRCCRLSFSTGHRVCSREEEADCDAAYHRLEELIDHAPDTNK